MFKRRGSFGKKSENGSRKRKRVFYQSKTEIEEREKRNENRMQLPFFLVRYIEDKETSKSDTYRRTIRNGSRE